MCSKSQIGESTNNLKVENLQKESQTKILLIFLKDCSTCVIVDILINLFDLSALEVFKLVRGFLFMYSDSKDKQVRSQ